MSTLKDKAAIVGIGWTKYSKNSGVSVLSLALEACTKAIDDAGLKVEDIDGIVTYNMGDSVPPMAVATYLGLPQLRYNLEYRAGGNGASSSVATAALAVIGGMARNVVVFRAMNGRSGFRLGGSGWVPEASGEAQFTFPFGWVTFAQYLAMWCRRHMIEYGTTSRQLGAIAVACRKHASLNERAQMRTPITIEEHQNSPLIVDPFRLLDICVETDGGCAVVVTTAERARDLRHRPVYIMAAAHGGGPKPGYEFNGFIPWEDYTKCYAHYIAPQLFGMAGITPKDVDVAEIYDCFTFSCLLQMEGFGFCKPGEGGAFVEGGRIELGGELPLNTHGGLLSEGYIHGLNHVVEAVSQLRGEAGPRQVKDAEVALTSGFGTTTGSALLLRR